MTRSILVSVLLALTLLPAAAFAQQDQPANLPTWDGLTPAQRELLTAPIRERWNRAPGERARMLERAERWQSLAPEQRRRAYHGMQRFEHMTDAQRTQARALFHAVRGMDAAQRKVFLADWKSKTAEERRAWVETHPAPRRDAKRARSGD